MSSDEKRPLRISVEEAARIVYGAQQPDWRQVGQVRALILRGTIRGSEDGRWTTAEAVAEYLATANLRRRSAERDRRAAGGEGLPSHRSPLQRKYRSDYRDVLKEYFLAVIRRRDRRGYSRPFQRAVLAGQIVLLAGIAALLTVFFFSLRPAPEPPELAVVRAWLDENTDRYRIIQWYPPESAADGQGSTIRVIYDYAETSPKTIQTDRVFVIHGSRVTSVESGG
jgi:hypothetical protein